MQSSQALKANSPISAVLEAAAFGDCFAIIDGAESIPLLNLGTWDGMHKS